MAFGVQMFDGICLIIFQTIFYVLRAATLAFVIHFTFQQHFIEIVLAATLVVKLYFLTDNFLVWITRNQYGLFGY